MGVVGLGLSEGYEGEAMPGGRGVGAAVWLVTKWGRISLCLEK